MAHEVRTGIENGEFLAPLLDASVGDHVTHPSTPTSDPTSDPTSGLRPPASDLRSPTSGLRPDLRPPTRPPASDLRPPVLRPYLRGVLRENFPLRVVAERQRIERVHVR